ncbi:uncharacterized protein [Macaca fascicularis]|uniref:uncharacterized protein n=1 Tax=Macaca fascicularis TaxID=9541 RepID=UPI003D15BDA3
MPLQTRFTKDQGALSIFPRSVFAGSSRVALSDEAAPLFLLLPVTDGTTCSCRHRPGRCHRCHRCHRCRCRRHRCFKTIAATAKKGLLLSWSQVAANFTCFSYGNHRCQQILPPHPTPPPTRFPPASGAHAATESGCSGRRHVRGGGEKPRREAPRTLLRCQAQRLRRERVGGGGGASVQPWPRAPSRGERSRRRRRLARAQGRAAAASPKALGNATHLARGSWAASAAASAPGESNTFSLNFPAPVPANPHSRTHARARTASQRRASGPRWLSGRVLLSPSLLLARRLLFYLFISSSRLQPSSLLLPPRLPLLLLLPGLRDWPWRSLQLQRGGAARRDPAGAHRVGALRAGALRAGTRGRAGGDAGAAALAEVRECGEARGGHCRLPRCAVPGAPREAGRTPRRGRGTARGAAGSARPDPAASSAGRARTLSASLPPPPRFLSCCPRGSPQPLGDARTRAATVYPRKPGVCICEWWFQRYAVRLPPLSSRRCPDSLERCSHRRARRAQPSRAMKWESADHGPRRELGCLRDTPDPPTRARAAVALLLPFAPKMSSERAIDRCCHRLSVTAYRAPKPAGDAT